MAGPEEETTTVFTSTRPNANGPTVVKTTAAKLYEKTATITTQNVSSFLLAFSREKKNKRERGTPSIIEGNTHFFDPATFFVPLSHVFGRGSAMARQNGDYYTYCFLIFFMFLSTVIIQSSKVADPHSMY
mmetsp:Transcript_8162/g.22698  ORF Transcript_8162/g.22698 Transcript_8162/m.22698 type:complete len:130 (-) Transcript_8162:140-529(-)